MLQSGETTCITGDLSVLDSASVFNYQDVEIKRGVKYTVCNQMIIGKWNTGEQGHLVAGRRIVEKKNKNREN